jgi:hypothetical protein
MPPSWQYALTVGPLGFYLWVLALWQSDRFPRVVRGPVDSGMLAFGVGGVLAFGPIGHALARVLASEPGLRERVVVASGVALWACFMARRAARRLVVYHVDADRLIPALSDVLGQTGGRYVKTMAGFEDVTSPRGVRLEFTRLLRCAVVEAHGLDAEGLIRAIGPPLEQRLRGKPTRRSWVALGLYGGSILVLLAPLVGVVLTQPRAWSLLRVWLRSLGGG